MSFVPSGIPTIPSLYSSSLIGSKSAVSGINPAISAGSFASRAGMLAAERYGPVLAGAALNRLDKSVSGLAAKISGDSSGNGSNGNGNNNSRSSSSYSGNDNGNPPPPPSSKGGRRPRRKGATSSSGVYDKTGIPRFSINTGIPSGTLINPLQKSTIHYSPLYVQCGRLFDNVVEQNDSLFSGLINSELYFKYKILVQSTITNSFSRYFTEECFYSYVSVLSKALQLYYMVDSILAYTSNNVNSNLAMFRLRMAMTSEILSEHVKLKEFLGTIPIPPNLLEYIRYLYQNFSFNDVEGSSIIRLSLEDSLCTSEYGDQLGLDLQYYNEVMAELLTLSETFSVLRKVRENWVKELPPSSFEAFYDPQFSTFWHNSNICYEDYGSKKVKYTINATDNTSLLYYGIFDNRLDGIIYASSSVNVNINDVDVCQTGIWKPFSDFKDRKSINSSLLHFSNDNLMRPVTSQEHRNASMVHAAPYTLVTPDKNLMWVVTESNFAGSTIPQVHTLENTTQAVVRSVEWLLNP